MYILVVLWGLVCSMLAGGSMGIVLGGGHIISCCASFGGVYGAALMIMCANRILWKN